MANLDKTDLLILRHLQANSRLTTKELAEKVNLSSTPVYERVKRLEKEGYIKKYAAILDFDKLNRGFAVYCNVKLSKINAVIAADFTNHVKKLPEVTECYNISGDFDYLLKVQAVDMKHYQLFLLEKLGKINTIAGIQSIFVMDTIKEAFEAEIDGSNRLGGIEYYI